jgi:hypothetical protein
VAEAKPQDFQSFRASIKNDLQARIAAHRQDVAAAPGKLNLIADGDSWFDYPLADEIPVPSDTIVQLRDLLGEKARILSLAHYGLAMTDMMGVSKRQLLEQQLRNGDNGRFAAILFSGGGNDLVGDQYRLWLRDAAAAGSDPSRAIDQLAMSDVLGIVDSAYRDLFALRDAVVPGIPIFVHAYDFARPTGKGVCDVGPWLAPSLESRGWMKGTSDPEVAKGAGIVKLMLLEVDKLMRDYAADRGKNVVYVETQGTLGPDEWANELHPTPGGFKKIAAKFAAVIGTHFPGRLS